MMPSSTISPHPTLFNVTVEQPSGFFSNIVSNMKGLSSISKIAVIAISLLIAPIVIVGSFNISGHISAYAVGAAIILPALSLYLIADLLQAVRMFTRDFSTIDGQ